MTTRIATTAALVCCLLASVRPSSALASLNPPWAITTGFSELLVLGPVSSALTPSWDVTAHGPLYGALVWSAGGRLSFGPVLPEMFARVSANPRFEKWSPTLGLELGVSGRARDDQGDALLAELREQSRSEVVPMYIAMHAAPLRFVLWKRLSISALEIQTGTYLAPFGRFVRLQVGILAGGVTL